MVEIHSGLFIGNEGDYEYRVRRETGWRVVQACKEPYHRQALGYTGRAAPKTHPEYLIARRGDRLVLNLVDADDPAYIPKAIMDAALAFVDESLGSGGRVFVHCNQGHSRAPSIGLLYLASRTDRLPGDFQAAEIAFRTIYPAYNPAPGVRGFLRIHWDTYRATTGLNPSRSENPAE